MEWAARLVESGEGTFDSLSMPSLTPPLLRACHHATARGMFWGLKGCLVGSRGTFSHRWLIGGPKATHGTTTGAIKGIP
jgi:hypothetical protein